MLQVWAKRPGGSTRIVRACGLASAPSSSGSGSVAPWTIAPGCSCAAASSSESQPGSGRQSSSVNATSGARAARHPRLRWRAGPRSFTATRMLRTGSGARASGSAASSWTTISSQRSRPSVCAASASSSRASRTGRACDGTTTLTSTTRGEPRSNLPPMAVTVPASTEQITYPDLYARWEKGNWRATEIDFSQDRVDWHERLSEEQRRGALWIFALFFHGEESVTANLCPYIEAAPTAETEHFLTTQQVDEARHTVFFKRFMHEVAGV